MSGANAGPLMVGVQGLELAAAEHRLLAHPAVCGVLLFARNYATPTQLRSLCVDIHSIGRPAPLLIAVDQEGGRVQRFVDGFTRLPAMGVLGERYDSDRDAALRAAREMGWLLAAELRAHGVDFSFAPVLDRRDDRSRVIAARALHAQPGVVVALGEAFSRGLADAGMAAVAKHFPGHGSVLEDSHLELPVDARPRDEIEATDLRPFAALGCHLPGVLAAHVRYPAVDFEPASFSRRWLCDILRGRLGFQGVVFSDDLGMGAALIAGGVAKRVQACLAAGCDVALACNEPTDAMLAIADALVEDEAMARLRGARLAGMRPSGPQPPLTGAEYEIACDAVARLGF